MVIDQCNSRQCTQFILPTFDNWREWLILLQSTRMVDSDICIDKIGWFYPNRESTFWTMHAILELHIPILAMRNNKMGHRINKMWTLINKVGHRNVKLVDTYQQVWFKKQQNGSRVLYHARSQDKDDWCPRDRICLGRKVTKLHVLDNVTNPHPRIGVDLRIQTRTSAAHHPGWQNIKLGVVWRRCRQ